MKKAPHCIPFDIFEVINYHRLGRRSSVHLEMWVSSPQASTDIKPRLAETEAAWNTTLPSFQTIDEGHAEQGKLEPGVVKF